MQIYNFEKNRKLAKEELDIRLKKNSEVFSNMKISCDENDKDKRFDINNIKYPFIKISNKTIGNKDLDCRKTLKTISSKKIDYQKFENCVFNNIEFENCTFFGSNFEKCKFINVRFYECNFEDEKKTSTYFGDNCLFDKCKFYKTNMRKVIFSESEFRDVEMLFTNLRNSIFDKCKIKKIIFSDCNLKAMNIIESYIEIFRFEDEFASKVDENTFIDFVKVQNKSNENYEKLFKVYTSISSIFERNRLFSYSGEYYYLAKCAQRQSLKGIKKLKSNIFFWSCGYGERPTFTLISSIEIVLIFSLIYMFCGVCINQRIIHYNLNVLLYLPNRSMYKDFIYCFYFSLATFTAVGYGDIFPIGYSVLFSCIEMLLGVTLVGIWTATLARKITR